MKPRRIAILCINPWNSIVAEFQPFSYPAYRVQASLLADPRLEGVEVELFEGRGWDVDTWIERVGAFDPDVIGASCYVWSLPMFVPVLQQLKAENPALLNVLGGPAARVEMLEHAPYRHCVEFVDALVLGVGEGTMSEVALRWREPLGDDIPDLAIARGGRWEKTTAPSPVVDVESIASPFQLGLVPDGKSAHLQTFQGCPMTCSFCAWGLGDGKRGVFSAEYLKRELRAFRGAGVQGVMSVDAGLNLNAAAYRNLMEAEAEVGVLREMPFHVEVYPSRVDDGMLEFLSGMACAEVGVGLQSYDPEVLKTSKRRLKVNNFETVVGRLAEVSHLKVELIMGLPGDTPENFRRSVERALELPCHLLQIFHCLVLPDALMSNALPAFQLDYDPISLQLRSSRDWSRADLERTAAWLDELVAERGGITTSQWPEHTSTRTLEGSLGQIPGAPMWVLRVAEA